MTLVNVLHAIGLAGIFPSRAFIPAFATAMLLRFGHSGVIDPKSVPPWFTHDYTLVALGILSALEIAATKSADVRQFMHDIDKYLKSAVAFLTINGLLSFNDLTVIDHVQQAGIGSMSLSVILTGFVFWASLLRQSALGILVDADEHDDIGLQKLISWMEELWVAFGVLLAIFYPLLMIVCIALLMGGLYLIQRYFEYRDEQSKIPCAACGHPLYPSALNCPKCRAQVAEPKAVGFFGQPCAQTNSDRRLQSFTLVEKKRCPVCAKRLHVRSVRQQCPACGHQLMEDAAIAADYVAFVNQRLPRVLTVCTVLSVVPVLGLIAGVIYYRLTLIAPFRRYIPFHIGFLVKWGVRVLNFFLILLQLIPICGILVVPLMAFVNYRVYRWVYQSALGTPRPNAPRQQAG